MIKTEEVRTVFTEKSKVNLKPILIVIKDDYFNYLYLLQHQYYFDLTDYYNNYCSLKYLFLELFY